MDKDFIQGILQKYGSPLYLYDGNKINYQYESLKRALPNTFQILYSLKANPSLGILQIFNRLNSGIEVASTGELKLAIRAGFSPEKIIYTCPGKTREGIEFAINNDIHCFIIESLDEAKEINKIAEQNRKIVNIAVRINPDFQENNATIKMSGISTQFGFDLPSAEVFFEKNRLSLNNLNVIGIHVYMGTQILNAESIIRDMKQIIELALGLSEKYNFNLKFLDLGGGFGVPYFPDEKPVDLKKLEEGAAELWDKYSTDLNGTDVYVESGRFLMADSGVFITTVLSKKKCGEQKYVICDGGYSQHPSAGYIGKFNKNRFPVKVLGKDDNAEMERVNIVGPTGTPADILAKDVLISKVKKDDVLILEKSGAYGLTNSYLYFISHSIPAEIIIIDDQIHLLRKQGSIENILSGQQDLDYDCYNTIKS